MQHTSPFLSINNSSFPSTSTSTFPPNHHHHHHHFPSFSRSRFLHYPILHSSFKPKTTLLLPPIPPKTPHIQSISPPPPNNHHHEFQEKMLYLDSIGIDFSTTINNHPPVISTPLSDIKSTVDYMISMEFTLPELRRIVSMCPELLSSPLSRIIPVFTFLLREVRVDISDLKRVINRRPRLLACSVKHRLRPTLYFIQSIGISDAHRHTYLLSCSVEDKLILRIEFFEKIGFCHRDAISMFRRFPQLFNYSVKDNYEVKLNYFVMEMGRDLKEIKEFPQYFSFSLENRIKPRHQCCVEKGLCFPLSVLLKSSETQFRDRMEVCCSSSMPFRTSPLSTTNCCYIQVI